MKPGLYEQLVTFRLRKQLATTDLQPEHDEPGELAPQLLARYASEVVHKALRNLPEEERAERQRALMNQVLSLLSGLAPAAGIDESDLVSDPLLMLLSLKDPAQQRLGTGEIERPRLPLRQSDLVINGPRDLSVGHQIRSELASADAVDVLVSFVKWTGIRVLKPELERFAAQHPGKLRVLTTTYMGATEAEALDALEALGATVKVSYDTRQTRLHAKAWLFHRESNFSTAIIGSSNLSYAALHDGCEWNVRLSRVDNETILKKFETTFSQYWDDPGFEPYERARFAEVLRYRDPERDALARAVQLRPYPHQAAALDKLANERAHGHNRNLIIAATGTGKTVIAALDYVRLRKQAGSDLRLLFIAHREEILQQSLAKYRAALGDAYFGEVMVGGKKPRSADHVFASIQSLHAEQLEKLRADAYDVIVIDEFHHAAAESYRAVLEHFQPRYLLGLTATPERTDGKSILEWFDHRIAAELRLWNAIDQGLVVPFQYFGVHDETNLSRVDFKSGRYDVASLEQIYTADHVRAAAVLRAIHATIRAPHTMRALGFCVSVRHAEFMAAYCNSKGLRARAVDGESSTAERAAALQELRSGAVNVLFVRDLFNEGLDLPGIDTVLFLRPTESATIFLQQLGRGLRTEEGKSCLTVLDFIGDANRQFRFVDRFRALTRGTRAEVSRAIDEGFPRLPAGCEIRLDPRSQEIVLANVRQAITNSWRQLAEDLRHLGDVDLPAFLAAAEIEPEELYAGKDRTYAALRRRAGVRTGELEATSLTRAIPRMLHVDDDARLQRWSAWLREARPPTPDGNDPFMLMLYAALGHVRRPIEEMTAALEELWAEPELREEILQLLHVLEGRPRRPTREFAGLPFRVHARYSRDEISAGLLQTRRKKDPQTGELEPAKLLRTQGGVFSCEDARADILYVELDKDPKHYTPTTLYDDRAITPSLFHWESQSKTRADSDTGLRYIESATSDWRILLFVREAAHDDRGFIAPYMFLGRVRYVGHEAEKPMRITWKLEQEMPLDFFSDIKIAAG